MTTPSITYWHQLEPTVSGESLQRGLQAQVRDPVWFLARQWQLGEFQGEDAASPSFVNFRARFAPIDGWRPGKGSVRDFDGSVPLEALSQNEASTPDLRTAVELGQALEARLTAIGGNAATVQALRSAFPVPTVAQLSEAQARDRSLVRLVRVCGGVSTHGIAALRAARESAPTLPPVLNGLPAGAKQLALAALTWLVGWTDVTLGPLGYSDAMSWRVKQQEYDVEVAATTPDGDRVTLAAHAGPFGEVDWYAFDEIARESGAPLVETPPVVTSMLPAPVRLSGMPDPRWWQFEDARYNWAALDVDRRELGKLLVMDFMLVQSNDWYVVPFGQQVGTLVQIDQVLVRDVFGDWTLVDRSDASGDTGNSTRSMFSVTSDVTENGRAGYFVLPPGAVRSTLDGPDLEEVRFVRDEQANMVWAIETLTEDGAGRPWPGRERAADVPDGDSVSTPSSASLRYRLQTEVPVNWIPFVPVQVDDDRREVELERAAMVRLVDGSPVPVRPVGRVLLAVEEDSSGDYFVREEEVPRSGTRVVRANRRARWIDGSTHLWTSRRRLVGTGEAASGLRYDVVEETEPADG